MGAQTWSRYRLASAVIVGSIFGFVLAGCGSSGHTSGPDAAGVAGQRSADAASNVTVRGDLTLASSHISRDYSEPFDCNSSGTICGQSSNVCSTDRTSGFGDLQKGANVTVYNASGKVVGVGQLSRGTIPSAGSRGSADPVQCKWSFSVANLPRSDFYGISVTHRGTVNFSAQQVRDGNVHLSLSGP